MKNVENNVQAGSLWASNTILTLILSLDFFIFGKCKENISVCSRYNLNQISLIVFGLEGINWPKVEFLTLMWP